MQGQICLVQVPTVWNLADVGTKPLGCARLRLLLHLINVASNEGADSVGDAEYEIQTQKHGSARQLKALAKGVARVVLLMGLEPTMLVNGVSAISILDDDELPIDGLQCSKEPNTGMMQTSSMSWTFILVCFSIFIALLIFLYKTYRMAADAFASFESLYTDVAILESAIQSIRNELQTQNQNIQRVHVAQGEIQGELEMLVDSIEGVHWGLVNLGGYSHFEELTAAQREHMFALERGNLVASRAMGLQRYVQTIREANAGVVHGGQNTDVGMVQAEEGGESEGEPTDDPEVRFAAPTDDLSRVLDILRDELNEALRRRSWMEANQLQNGCMQLLDVVNRNVPVPPGDRRNLFTNLSTLMRQMSQQQSVNAPMIAERYQQFSNQLQEMSLM